MSDDRPVTARDINPYAAPRVGDAIEPFAEAGVGVWRDADLVVMHERAELPPYCVKTGVPTTGRFRTMITGWTSETSWRTGRSYIAVPLAQPWRRSMLRCHRMITPWFFALIFIALVAVLIDWNEPPPGLFATTDFVESKIGALTTIVLMWAIFAIFVLFTVGLLIFVVLLLAEPLAWVRRRGHYLWLRGAEPSFLNRLPVWPYGK